MCITIKCVIFHILTIYVFILSTGPILLIHLMATPTMISLDTYAEFSYENQVEKGDMLGPDFIPDVTTKVKVETAGYDVNGIKRMRNKLTEEEKAQFDSSYGELSTLLDIKVDWGCIRAALRFWDPYYRCFSFDKGVDLTPTLEEYATLLCCPFPITSINQNVRLDSASVKVRIDRCLGIATHFRNRDYLWCWSDIEKQFNASQGEKRVKIMAFAIVGMVLFP